MSSAWIFTLAVAVSGTAADRSERPNVVMIIGDDQAWTDYAFMGHPTIHTPHLDRLAAESAVFRKGYVPTSLCRPSLVTLISGLYPHQHKVAGNDPVAGVPREALLKHIDRIPTLPRWLATRGYASFQSGKWWEGNYARGGFTAGMTHGDPDHGGRHGDDGLKIGREGLQPIFDFIDRTAEQPFFIWYAPLLPHTPHNPPQRLLEKYASPGRAPELARYFAMCQWFDETCGELLDGLQSRGLSENTLVVFVADNGWLQRTADTELPADWRYPFAPRSKRSPYEAGIRTPIMLHWPGRIRPAVYDTPIASIDLAPTILAAAGIEPPTELPGINLLPAAIDGQAVPALPIFGAIFSHDVPDIDDPSPGLQYRWCVAEGWKLIVPADQSEAPELYDLAADPHEATDLAAQQPQEVARLQELIHGWWNVATDH